MTENNFDKIKKLIKIIGGKAIIVENGKPTFVIINVDEYVDFEDTVENSKEKIRNNIENSESAEKVNMDINIWKSRQDEKKMKQLKMEKDFKKSEIEKQPILNDDIVVENL
ncbi:hypothetical protein K0B03_00930 [Patescibacteria group bacterium]|nr:hypothetical protein [Patescibacteria group bacterium]